MDQNSAQKLIDQNREVYNTIAPFFSDTRAFVWEELKPLARFTKPGYRILDVGSGNGRLYQIFAKKQAHEGEEISALDTERLHTSQEIEYVGIDQSEELVEIARKKVPLGSFFVGGMTDLPFENAEFDIVYCIAAFHHLPNTELRLKALSEMKRVLKSDGLLIMTNWNLHSQSAQKNVEKGKWRVDESNHFMVPWLSPEGTVLGERYYYGFEPEELKELFAKTDMELMEQYYVRKGCKTDRTNGNNIVSILKKIK